MFLNQTILVAPLNWGLGHATRCIPIIRELLQNEGEVIIGSNGRALRLLQEEFPNLTAVPLNSFHIRYSRVLPFWMKAGAKVPSFLYHCRQEYQQTQHIVRKFDVDAIISDNRYGVWSREIPSACLIHQLQLPLPSLFQWLSSPINHLHHRLLQPFDQIWVPDYQGNPRLSGKLSEAGKLSFKTQFIGPLSRFSPVLPSSTPFQYEVTAVLSGPEPQRSILEDKLLEQMGDLPYQSLLIRGTDESNLPDTPTNVKVEPLLHSQELQKALLQSRWIIARAGYSTIMDLVRLQRTACLIPTPGQPEQEYLARHLREQGLFYTAPQDSFNLKEGLHALDSGGYSIPDFKKSRSTSFLSSFCQLLEDPSSVPSHKGQY